MSNQFEQLEQLIGDDYRGEIPHDLAHFLMDWARFGRVVFALMREAITDGFLDVSSETLADKAVEAGIIQRVAYDPEVHGGRVGAEEELEPGDMIYWWGEPLEQTTEKIADLEGGGEIYLINTRCPHGLKPEECNDCMIAGDIAFDIEREGRVFPR